MNYIARIFIKDNQRMVYVSRRPMRTHITRKGIPTANHRLVEDALTHRAALRHRISIKQALFPKCIFTTYNLNMDFSHALSCGWTELVVLYPNCPQHLFL